MKDIAQGASLSDRRRKCSPQYPDERMKRILAGAVAPDQVSLYLNAADVLALCSVKEGSPTVVKEALACGLPVVSTDVGDVRDVLSASSNLGTIAPADEREFADSLAHWLTNESLGDEARANRRRVAQQYDTRRMGARLVQTCDDLTRGRQ